jgi:diaminohydroxyphosphoribosylaminopyrimidine deaminase/5-amino-6-(5-phosphoribosylamino)uracil reductase
LRLFSDASSRVIDPFLRRAFVLAESGRGTTSPNPVVGCVIVREGVVVGEGFHERAGGPHAEVVALLHAGERARGATAYVTLEPCNHTGRTGPCTAALTEAGVSRVIVGMPDPNPEVEGGGAVALRQGGIDVVFAEDPTPFEEQNEAWLHWMRSGRPWLQAKVALTLDGRTAAASGVRTRITGEGAASVTSRLRAAADAVLVGAATVASDDPALTARDAAGASLARQPLRVVLARGAAPAHDRKVFTDGAARTLLLAEKGSGITPPSGVAFQEYPADDGIRGALEALGERDVTRLLVEPGPRLFSALWDADLIDELVLAQAGGVLGAQAAALYGGALHHGAEHVVARMRPVEAGIAGEDVVTVWRRRTR